VSTNRVARAVSARTPAYSLVSPVNGEVIDEISLASPDQLAAVCAQIPPAAPGTPPAEVFAFLDRLSQALTRHRERMFQLTVLETGFIARDSAEMIDGSISFLREFATFARSQAPRQQLVRHSYSMAGDRDMRIASRPLSGVAGVVPQNASLSLSITILAAALYAGARVILRPSLQGGATGALLARLVEEADPPSQTIWIVNSLARDFVDVSCSAEAIDLIHCIGSNRYAIPVLTQSFEAGKTCLLDGQGNGLLYVDEGFDVAEAAAIITAGATRYNGETCTSVNGVLAHPSIYGRLRDALAASFSALRVGHPLDADVDIGPLFSEKQAGALAESLEQHRGASRLLCGGQRDGAYFTPSVLEKPRSDDPLVTEGLFGPVIWIAPGDEREAPAWLRRNRFPLSDTVLSHRADVIQDLATKSRAARICLNTDPSIESMFEPWGGYPPSGMNPVSIWTEKYRQAYQLDGRLDEVLAVVSPG